MTVKQKNVEADLRYKSTHSLAQIMDALQAIKDKHIQVQTLQVNTDACVFQFTYEHEKRDNTLLVGRLEHSHDDHIIVYWDDETPTTELTKSDEYLRAVLGDIVTQGMDSVYVASGINAALNSQAEFHQPRRDTLHRFFDKLWRIRKQVDPRADEIDRYQFQKRDRHQQPKHIHCVENERATKLAWRHYRFSVLVTLILALVWNLMLLWSFAPNFPRPAINLASFHPSQIVNVGLYLVLLVIPAFFLLYHSLYNLLNRTTLLMTANGIKSHTSPIPGRVQNVAIAKTDIEAIYIRYKITTHSLETHAGFFTYDIITNVIYTCDLMVKVSNQPEAIRLCRAIGDIDTLWYLGRKVSERLDIEVPSHPAHSLFF